jgi:hypothetical protein
LVPPTVLVPNSTYSNEVFTRERRLSARTRSRARRSDVSVTVTGIVCGQFGFANTG